MAVGGNGVRLWGQFGAGAVSAILLGACAAQTGGTTSEIPGYALAACAYVVEANVAACADRARALRDGDIAMAVAIHLAETSDTAGALQWTEDAAAWGNSKALRAMYDSYYFGKAPFAEDKAAAARTLDAALANGAQWARLLQASRIWATNAPQARALIAAAAEQNNCHAQALLAAAYYDGSLGEKNWTKAYFWLLLGQSGSTARLSEIHALTEVPAEAAPPAGFVTETCQPGRLPVLKPSMERALPASYLRSASGAVTRWRPGNGEPERAAPPDSAMVESQPQPGSTGHAPRMGVRAHAPDWQLIAFDRTAAAADRQFAAAEILDRAGKHVWTVAVASGLRGTVTQGSAVAIGPHRLITNCHLVDAARSIAVRQGADIRRATLVSASHDTDRCVLSVAKRLASYARTIRAFDSLKIGEPVIAIASPDGRAAAIGRGIVSGLRKRDAMRIVQTTAPISAGSSGGGLFDAAGNLVGITSVDAGDADALNFAIAAENFARAN
jgi:S1-C subfamily serine protease